MRFDKLPILETDRLILRAVTRQDVPGIFDYASDPEVSKLLEWGPSKSINETKQVVTEWISNYAQNRVAPWGIVDKKLNKIIGTIEARIVMTSPALAELGYCLSRDYWGKGFMVEAIKCVLQYLFTQTDVTEIIAFVRTDNTQSQRLLEKIGFGMNQSGAKRELMKEKWVNLDRWVIYR